MPDIVKTINSMAKFHHVIPQLESLNLSQVLNSIVVCRVCRGERIIAVKSPVTETFRFTDCYLCNGTGIMSNRELEAGENVSN